MAALYSIGPDATTTILDMTEIHQHAFLDHLGKLFKALITLDEILNNQTTLRDHWVAYKRVIRTAQMDPGRFKVEKEKLSLLKKLLRPTERKVLEANIFQLSVGQSFGQNSNGLKIANNTGLGDVFYHYLKSSMSEIEAELKNNSQGYAGGDDKLVGLCGIYVLHNNLYFTTEKKFFSRLLELCKKFPAISLHGNVMWFSEQFLLRHMPSLSQKC